MSICLATAASTDARLPCPDCLALLAPPPPSPLFSMFTHADVSGTHSKYNGQEKPGTVLSTGMWTKPLRVLVVEMKGDSKEPCHWAVGIVTMHAPMVLSHRQSVELVACWPSGIVQPAKKLLLANKKNKIKAFALTDKVEFERKIRCLCPKGTVNWSRAATIIEDQ